MADLAFPLINGRRHGFSSISLKFKLGDGNNVPMYVRSINYSRTRNRGLVRANHPDPIAKTLGENEYSGDLEIYEAELRLLLSQIGPGYGDAIFDVQVSYGEDGFDIVTDELKGCTLDNIDMSNSQGPDPLVRKIDLKPLKVIMGGVDDLEIPLGPPPGPPR